MRRVDRRLRNKKFRGPREIHPARARKLPRVKHVKPGAKPDETPRSVDLSFPNFPPHLLENPIVLHFPRQESLVDASAVRPSEISRSTCLQETAFRRPPLGAAVNPEDDA